MNSMRKHPLKGLQKDSVIRTYNKIIKDNSQNNNEYNFITGVYNKIIFIERLKDQLLKAYNSITVLLIDINDLRIINKLLGFNEEELLLKNIASTLVNICGNQSIIGRWNDDQFIIAIFDNSEQEIKQKCGKIIDQFHNIDKKAYASIEINYVTKTSPMISVWDIISEVECTAFQEKTLKGIVDKCSSYYTILRMLQIKNSTYEIHSERLSDYCYKLGVKLGMNKFELYKMQLFSKLHDVGKIFVKDEILNKESKLSEDEWIEMRMHSENGYLITKEIPDLNCISYFIKVHHERWDGLGYPLGLRDRDIPLHARILSVVDAYDAMTNDRPYRKALTVYEALRELKRNAAKQFDPVIVDMFIKMVLQQDVKINIEEKLAPCN